jgi:TolA-binding protein
VSSNSGHALAASVKINLVELDRAEGNHEALAERLQKELDGSSDLPEDLLLYQLARTRKDLGQADEAQELYQQILDQHPGSPYAAIARQATTQG